MKNKEPFDFERFKNEAMKGLYQGKKMGGTDGIFAPMLKHLLESMLEGELDNHLQESKATDDPNRRNGRTKKMSAVCSLENLNWKARGTAMEHLNRKLSLNAN